MRRLMVALATGMTLAFSVSAQVYQVVGPPPRRSTTATARRTPRPNRSSEDRSGRGLRGTLRLHQQIGVRYYLHLRSRISVWAPGSAPTWASARPSRC